MAKLKLALDLPQRPVITFRTYKKVPPIKNYMASMTNPDHSMSLREIYDRFATGRASDGFDAVYDDDEFIPDFSMMDKVEIAQYHQSLVDRLKDISKRISNGRDAVISKAEKARELEFNRLKKAEEVAAARLTSNSTEKGKGTPQES